MDVARADAVDGEFALSRDRIDLRHLIGPGRRNTWRRRDEGAEGSDAA